MPVRYGVGKDEISPVMDQISGYMGRAALRAIPADVTDLVKQHVLDTLAAMVSGSQLKPGRVALDFASSYGGKSVATVVCSKVLCGPIEAALTNAVLAQSDETDDSHSPSLSHPGSSVVPSALAVGEQFGIDGAHYLRAVALGYDIGTRLTMTLGGGKVQTEHHRSTHALTGIFGSSAAAACAADLNARQMRWVLDYASQQASGIAAWQRDTDHVEKSFVFAGMGARDGVTSALLVHSGWTGVDDIFSGPDNFFAAYGPKANPANLVQGLGERYEVTRTNIKKWSVGSPIQAPLDALENIMREHPFTPNQVQKVLVRVATEEALVVNNRQMPDVNLQYMIAVMLLDKTASFRAAHDKARMQDPAVLREKAKVDLVPDSELQKLLPKRIAIVEVTLNDGRQFVNRVDAVRGTAENPMTSDEVVAKARDLMEPILGSATCKSLVEKVLAMENVKDVRELRPLLQRG